jgi:hypothetical protein
MAYFKKSMIRSFNLNRFPAEDDLMGSPKSVDIFVTDINDDDLRAISEHYWDYKIRLIYILN